jgi:organic radical activating enzyme
MANKAVFEGLVFDENDNVLNICYVGGEPCYVINDVDFLRHIPAQQVDTQVLDVMREQITENKDLISEQTAKMMGQDDIFTHAIINHQLENIDDQLKHLMDQGMPESGRSYLGMLGFKIVVNYHGEVIRVDQPASQMDEE